MKTDILLILLLATSAHAAVTSETICPLPSLSPDDSIVLTPDAQHFALAHNDHGSAIFLVDGIQKGSATSISAIALSPDAAHWAYAGFDKDNTPVLCVDGKISNPGGSVLLLQISPDAKHTTYLLDGEQNDQIVVFDGQQIPDSTVGIQWAISPDALHMAFRVPKADPNPFTPRETIYIDGKISEKPTFTVDNHEFTYIGSQILPSSDPTCHLEKAATPDGRHTAAISYLAKGAATGSGFTHFDVSVTLDGRPVIPALSDTHLSRIAISPNGARVAFTGTNSVYVDQTKIPTGLTSQAPFFSSDSVHVAFVTQREDARMVTIDGAQLPQYRLLHTQIPQPDLRIDPIPTTYHFSPDNTLQFFAWQDGKLLKVTWKP